MEVDVVLNVLEGDALDVLGSEWLELFALDDCEWLELETYLFTHENFEILSFFLNDLQRRFQKQHDLVFLEHWLKNTNHEFEVNKSANQHVEDLSLLGRESEGDCGVHLSSLSHDAGLLHVVNRAVVGSRKSFR